MSASEALTWCANVASSKENELRRIAKVRMDYRETKETPVPWEGVS